MKTKTKRLAVELPERAEARFRPRSGPDAKHDIGVLNKPGTIDSHCRGETRVVLFNTSDRDCKINRGDRIVQLVFSILTDVDLVETDSLPETSRGPDGFGHTG